MGVFQGRSREDCPAKLRLGEIGVAQEMAPRGVCGSYGRTERAILGDPSGFSTGLRSGPIIGVPNSTRHMRQLPAMGNLSW